MADPRLSTDSNCGNCFAWKTVYHPSPEYGQCLRHAPKRFRDVNADGEFEPEYAWPVTFAEEGCCEWLPMQGSKADV